MRESHKTKPDGNSPRTTEIQYLGMVPLSIICKTKLINEKKLTARDAAGPSLSRQDAAGRGCLPLACTAPHGEFSDDA